MPRQNMENCQNAVNAGQVHANHLDVSSGNTYVFNVSKGAVLNVYMGDNNIVNINKETLGKVSVQNKEQTRPNDIEETPAEPVRETSVVCRHVVAHDAFGKIIEEGHDVAIWERDAANKQHSFFLGCGVYVGQEYMLACFDNDPIVVKLKMNYTEHKYHNCVKLGTTTHSLRELADRAREKEGKKYKNSTRFINDVHGQAVY